jgi:hypothetical protein
MTDASNIPKRWRVPVSYGSSSEARAANAIELDMLRRLCRLSKGRAG